VHYQLSVQIIENAMFLAKRLKQNAYSNLLALPFLLKHCTFRTFYFV